MSSEPLPANRPEHARLSAPVTVTRPWGREIWYAIEREYAGKILELTRGHTLAMREAELTTETMYLLSGHVWFHLNGLEFDWIPGATLTLRPGDVHRMHALQDSVVLKVGAPDAEAVDRVQDSHYGRA